MSAAQYTALAQSSPSSTSVPLPQEKSVEPSFRARWAGLGAVWLSALLMALALFFSGDSDRCDALLHDGSWASNTTWQPPSCMMKEYKADDIAQCSRNQRIFFAGDSTVRQMFFSVSEVLAPEWDYKILDKHTPMFRVETKNVTIDFIWDPLLQRDEIPQQLAKMRNGDADAPSLTIVGGGLHHAYLLPNPKEAFVTSMDKLFPPGLPGMSNVLIAPVVEPKYQSMNEGRRKTITPERIAFMNDFIRSNLSHYPTAWSFAKMREGRDELIMDENGIGLHSAPFLTALKAQTILNLHCNKKVDAEHQRPHDRTCCTKYSYNSTVQLLLMVALVVLAGGFVVARDAETGSDVAFFVGAVLFCFVCDRTQVFGKLHKLHSEPEFIVMIVAAAVAGLAGLRRSYARQTAGLDGTLSTPDQVLLSRDQTDEWKGWMQAVILIYHWTGASRILWVYRLVRLLVSAYLFMTGYGNTVFYLRKADFGAQRLVSSLARINVLTLALAYVMSTDYLFYYFAPLVSFWMLFIYATMALGKKLNDSTVQLCLKIAFATMAISGVVLIPGNLELVFTLVGLLTGSFWDVREWRFRVALDLFIVPVGMLFAVVTERYMSESSSSDDDSETSTEKPAWAVLGGRRGARRSLLAIVGGIAGVVVWCIFALGTSTKTEYNTRHPVLSIPAVLAFVALRNSTRTARTTYSASAAWLGRCSLETFTLQFHIFLAADTSGTLSLGLWASQNPFLRYAEMAVISAVFLWISHHVAVATRSIVSILVSMPRGLPSSDGAETQSLLRRTLAKVRRSLLARVLAVLASLWALNIAFAVFI